MTTLSMMAGAAANAAKIKKVAQEHRQWVLEDPEKRSNVTIEEYMKMMGYDPQTNPYKKRKDTDPKVKM